MLDDECDEGTTNLYTDDAVIQTSTIASIEKPPACDLDYIQKYMETDEMGPQGLYGLDCSTWGSKEHPDHHATDLLTIKPALKEDLFSNAFVHYAVGTFFDCLGFFRRKRSKQIKEVAYRRESLLRITHFITCLVASIPPILSVVVLSTVTSLHLKLAMMAVFNLILAISLSIFANANRTEVFAVTAA
jgi:hypothetical protein